MNKKVIVVLSFAIFGSLWFVSHAHFRMACLKNARSGEDQKLYGHYHTSYTTADNHHCYFAFDPEDIIWVSLREARTRPELDNLTWLPSYQAKIIYFKNAAQYQSIIDALKKPGKTLKHLKQIYQQKDPDSQVPVFKSYKDVKTTMPKLIE